jgi:hypothetical protein
MFFTEFRLMMAICLNSWVTTLANKRKQLGLQFFFAFSRSATAALKLSFASAYWLVFQKPVKSGTLLKGIIGSKIISIFIYLEFFPIWIFRLLDYVPLPISPADPFKLGSRAHLAVLFQGTLFPLHGRLADSDVMFNGVVNT